MVGVSWFVARLAVLIPFSQNSHRIQGDEHSPSSFIVLGVFIGREGTRLHRNLITTCALLLILNKAEDLNVKEWQEEAWNLLGMLDQRRARKLRKIPIKGRKKSTRNICCDKDVYVPQYSQASWAYAACLNEVTVDVASFWLRWGWAAVSVAISYSDRDLNRVHIRILLCM